MEPVCFVLYFGCLLSCMELVIVVFVLIYSALIAPFFFSSICLCSFVGNKATCSSFLANYKTFVTSSASVVNV